MKKLILFLSIALIAISCDTKTAKFDASVYASSLGQVNADAGGLVILYSMEDSAIYQNHVNLNGVASFELPIGEYIMLTISNAHKRNVYKQNAFLDTSYQRYILENNNILKKYYNFDLDTTNFSNNLLQISVYTKESERLYKCHINEHEQQIKQLIKTNNVSEFLKSDNTKYYDHYLTFRSEIGNLKIRNYNIITSTDLYKNILSENKGIFKIKKIIIPDEGSYNDVTTFE